MKRYTRSSALRIAAFALFLGLPALALAQSTGLVPCGFSVSNLDFLNATSCNFCYLTKLIQAVVNFLVMVTIPISIAMFAWAGIMFFTSAGNPKRVARAKSIFSSVFIGFIVTISGWLIVQIVLQSITNSDFYNLNNWASLDCSQSNQNRPRNEDLGSLIGSNSLTPGTGTTGGTPTTPGTGGTSTGGGGGSGNPITVSSPGYNATPESLSLSTTQSDASLAATYDQVQARYGGQIQAACADSTISNCAQLVTATIAAESGGNPGAVSPVGARGLMQAAPGSPGYTCASSDTTCQINSGTGYLNTIYQQFPNTANALAGYNSGTATSPYSNGTKPGLAASSDCPGYYAWQCATNPGGLTETRNYVANICRTLTLKNSSC